MYDYIMCFGNEILISNTLQLGTLAEPRPRSCLLPGRLRTDRLDFGRGEITTSTEDKQDWDAEQPGH
jgi:hypothetical protein